MTWNYQHKLRKSIDQQFAEIWRKRFFMRQTDILQVAKQVNSILWKKQDKKIKLSRMASSIHLRSWWLRTHNISVNVKKNISAIIQFYQKLLWISTGKKYERISRAVFTMNGLPSLGVFPETLGQQMRLKNKDGLRSLQIARWFQGPSAVCSDSYGLQNWLWI